MQSRSFPCAAYARGPETPPRRNGAVIVLTLVLMVFIFAFVAFTIDVGYMALTKGELQTLRHWLALSISNREMQLPEPRHRALPPCTGPRVLRWSSTTPMS